jgi:N,N'-diacetyllegionaminate synthase
MSKADKINESTYTLSSNNKVLIIAEVASNHNGDLDTALQLIDTAAECGADVVKFQSFIARDIILPSDPIFDQLQKLEMPRQWYPVLMDRCALRGVRFLSTATSFTTLNWMEEFGVWGYKVASCNISFRPLIDRLIEIGKPIVFSTGLARFEEIKSLANYLAKKGLSDFAFLHCVSKYPAAFKELHLKNILLLRELLSCPVGYSDHSSGTHMAVTAVALGARIIEKHISLDKKGIGMDHDVAILPDEFAVLCQAVRDVEMALTCDVTPDLEGMFAMRRSLHFACELAAGETISAEAVKITRPEDGLLPENIEAVLGCTVRKRVEKDQPITMEILANEHNPNHCCTSR